MNGLTATGVTVGTTAGNLCAEIGGILAFTVRAQHQSIAVGSV